MRYIDADKLIEKIFPIGLIHDGNYTINAKAIKMAVDMMPTADVVPKKEIANVLSDLKHKIHDKAVRPNNAGIDAYISLKVFDAILQNYLKRLEEKNYEN